MQNKTILLISPEPWGINFVSKHHYANYLSEENTVYFLNPATGYVKNVNKGMDFKLNPTKKGLTVVNYLNLVPRLNHLPKWIQKFFYKKQAKHLQAKIGVENFDIIWSFDPNRFFDQEVWKADKRIYHTVDFHPKTKYEKDIVLSSDIFLSVTDLITQEHTTYRKAVLIPHAADIINFEKSSPTPIPGENKIKAIYTGNFHKHINYELLKNLASAHTNCDFIMIGPTTDSNLSSGNIIEQNILSAIMEMKNVYFMGSVPGSDLMNYLMQCDINLVLFKKENERLHCSPHKLMAYFYTGHITLSNYIDAHQYTDKDIIQMAHCDSELQQSFTAIIQQIDRYNSPELKEKRRNFALANSYSNKIKEIEKLIYP